MKFVIQRVNNADVTVDNKIVGSIGKGFLILLVHVRPIQLTCSQNLLTK